MGEIQNNTIILERNAEFGSRNDREDEPSRVPTAARVARKATCDAQTLGGTGYRCGVREGL